MSFTIYAKMKKLGKQKKEALEPVPFVLKSRPETLRELIIGLVELEVDNYNSRQDNGQVLGYLTREEINDRALGGKVSFGLRGGEDAKKDEASSNAILCFEDGIYRVFSDEKELTDLNEKIPWNENTVFTFIRLTMLSGI